MSASTQEETKSISRREVLAALAVVAAFGVAIGAAFVTGTGTGQVTRSVENISFTWQNWLGDFGSLLPVGFAFVAGMVAAVNPCGFAMLPAYLGIYLGSAEERAKRGGILSGALTRALWVSAMVTLGFIVLFGIAGILLSIATSTIAQYLPWMGLIIGAILILAAGLMLSGKVLYSALGERVADKLGGSAQQSGSRGYLAYGLGYGAASLSCTLPIFMAVVGSTLAVSGIVPAMAQFVLYALGMGFVITVLTISTAIFKSALVANIRGITRYVQPISSVLLLVAGAYIVYYWLTLGGLLETIV
jgi:cytochrome c-type biogenesis protein